MKRFFWVLPVIAGFILISLGVNKLLYSVNAKRFERKTEMSGAPLPEGMIALPAPSVKGTMSVEESLQKRRSARRYQKGVLSLAEVSQLLWAAYGVSDSVTFSRIRLKTAPSAGATYPLELYLMAGNVEGLAPGLYKYLPDHHALTLYRTGDIRAEVAEACLNQKMLEEAPASIIYAAVFERTVSRYGDRDAERYVCMDIGHSAQNVYLQATAMGMATCAIGAFNDEALASVVIPQEGEKLLYLLPLVYPRN